MLRDSLSEGLTTQKAVQQYIGMCMFKSTPLHLYVLLECFCLLYTVCGEFKFHLCLTQLSAFEILNRCRYTIVSMLSVYRKTVSY